MAESRFSSLNDWLSWMETLHPNEIDLGLSRIKNVADRLGIQKTSSSRIITVAGTNGKGSCIATLEKLFIETGVKVGTYTSPHIISYNERVKLQGMPVSDRELCEAFSNIDRARGEISLTYFEFGCLAAFLIFQASELDFWLLEIGLGGRLDAVNILSPDIAVITSIDLDHESWLGQTRDLIAREKLGILREGIPCICSEVRLTESMLEIFEHLGVSLFLRGEEFAFVQSDFRCEFSFNSSSSTTSCLTVATPNLPLPSVAAALQAYALCEDRLPDNGLGRDRMSSVIEGLSLAGRFERLETDFASIILDVAHNPAATVLLADKLKESHVDVDYAIVAMMADKKIHTALLPLSDFVGMWMPTELPGNARSESKENLAATLLDLGIDNERIVVCQNTQNAIQEVEKRIKTRQSICAESGSAESVSSGLTSTRKPVILVLGSFVTVAAAKIYFAG